MKKLWPMNLLSTVFLTLVLAACQTRAVDSLTVTKPAPSQTTAVFPTQPLPPTPEATAVPIPPTPSLPAPTLFATDWDNRDIFRAGLIDSQQAILDRLPGATVYHIDLQLDESLTAVNGRLEVRYTNMERERLDAIHFHLYPNLLGGDSQVFDIQINNQLVMPQFQFDQTILTLPLDAPLLPNEQIVIKMGFETAVPTDLGRNYGVLASAEDVLALAHFYPVISVYDDTGWNLEPAPESGDVTYADISFYLVRVTAPANQVIVASGIEIETATANDTQTIAYAAGPMRDFYLAASPNYVPITATIGQTRINSYAPAALGKGAQAVLDTATAALEIYGRRFGPYPFTELDFVNTPTLALGIEYPGMIAITDRIYDLAGNSNGTPNTIFLESVTAHEVGHQWFYSIVGNDQLDEPWLDESLTQYITWLYFLDRYGEVAADGFYQSLQGRWDSIEQANIPIGLPVSAYDGAEYSGIIYGRGPIFVDELAQTMGQETFDAFMRDYYMRYQWGIADTEKFQSLAQSHCNCDLNDLFADWIYAQ